MVLKRVKMWAQELLSKYLDHIFLICASYFLIPFLFTIFPVVVTKQMYVFYAWYISRYITYPLLPFSHAHVSRLFVASSGEWCQVLIKVRGWYKCYKIQIHAIYYLQFLNQVFMVKPKVFLPQEWVIPVDCGYSIMLYDIPATNIFLIIWLSFKYFHFQRTWGRSFQKRVVVIKCYICVFY
jgi:hypothetical protein